MDNQKTLTVESAGRIDKQISDQVTYSRATVQTLIESGKVAVNDDRVTKKSTSVKPGDRVILNLDELEVDDGPPQPEPGPLNVLHEDPWVLAVEKPSGMVVHPNQQTRSGTLVNRILFHYPEQKDFERAGLVHRLDRGTSGVLLVARTTEAIDGLKAQFKQRSIGKTYRALLRGILGDERIKVEVPVGRDPENPVRQAPHPGGKHAVTHLRRLASDGSTTAVKCHPVTGRTHQIRVHCQYLNAPVVGDEKYGDGRAKRLMLHAETIEFNHPKKGDDVMVTSDPPEEVMELWNELAPS